MREIECKWAHEMVVEFKFKFKFQLLSFCFAFYLGPILIEIKILASNEGFVFSLKLRFQLVIFVIIWLHVNAYNSCFGF